MATRPTQAPPMAVTEGLEAPVALVALVASEGPPPRRPRPWRRSTWRPLGYDPPGLARPSPHTFGP